MNKETVQWLLLALLVVGFVGFGVVVMNQGVQLTNISTALVALNTKIENIPQPSSNTNQAAPAAAVPSATVTKPATNTATTVATSGKSWQEYRDTLLTQKRYRGAANMNAYTQVFTQPDISSCDPANPDSEMFTCDPVTRTIRTGIFALYSDASWADGRNHTFYLGYGSEGGEIYFGPFTDNVLRLSQEAK